MAPEVDTPPQANTFQRLVWVTATGLQMFRARWGRRLWGGAIGLIADALAEGTSQAFYARLPGHPQQAPDSLERSGKDRSLFRFRGETDAAWLSRVFNAWDDYEQGGTPQVVKKMVNLWGEAGWPATWDRDLVTLDESGDPADWSFTVTIGYGCIMPVWTVWSIGDGHSVGDHDLYVGVGQSTDIATLLYLVRKWKRSASKGFIKVYTSVSDFVVFTV